MHIEFRRHETTHTLDYIVLLLILVVSMLVISLLRLSPLLVMLTTLLLSVAYVVWGVTHHTKAGHIDQKIVLEYLSFAALIDIIVYILLS